jgi:hypothetical protein
MLVIIETDCISLVSAAKNMCRIDRFTEIIFLSLIILSESGVSYCKSAVFAG